MARGKQSSFYKLVEQTMQAIAVEFSVKSYRELDFDILIDTTIQKLGLNETSRAELTSTIQAILSSSVSFSTPSISTLSTSATSTDTKYQPLTEVSVGSIGQEQVSELMYQSMVTLLFAASSTCEFMVMLLAVASSNMTVSTPLTVGTDIKYPSLLVPEIKSVIENRRQLVTIASQAKLATDTEQQLLFEDALNDKFNSMTRTLEKDLRKAFALQCEKDQFSLFPSLNVVSLEGHAPIEPQIKMLERMELTFKEHAIKADQIAKNHNKTWAGTGDEDVSPMELVLCFDSLLSTRSSNIQCEFMKDVCGEIANTIFGNIQEFTVKDFKQVEAKTLEHKITDLMQLDAIIEEVEIMAKQYKAAKGREAVTIDFDPEDLLHAYNLKKAKLFFPHKIQQKVKMFEEAVVEVIKKHVNDTHTVPLMAKLAAGDPAQRATTILVINNTLELNRAELASKKEAFKNAYKDLDKPQISCEEGSNYLKSVKEMRLNRSTISAMEELLDSLSSQAEHDTMIGFAAIGEQSPFEYYPG